MELREIGRGPAHGVSRGLPSEGMSPEGEVSVAVRVSERRWQPVPPGPHLLPLAL